MKTLKLQWMALTVLMIATCMPQIAAALPKSFAVFVASSTSTAARGGVAGTAFFISPREAITTYHVLQEKSFVVPDGFEHQQIWLVHEEGPIVELSRAQVRFDAANDLTHITIDQDVPIEFVFARGSVAGATRVSTDGFTANSTGPVFAVGPKGLNVTSVPKLSRIRLDGEIIQRARIELRAEDVNLKATPCVQVSFQPVRGISGGALIADGKVIGMNSFADPGGTSRTWAVELPNP